MSHSMNFALVAALSLFWASAAAHAQKQIAPPSAYPDTAAHGVYKCPLAKGGFEYTDRPCEKQGGKLIMQPDNAQAIDNLLYAGHPDQAQAFADEHNTQALYQERLKIYQARMDEVDQRQQREAVAEAQREEEARQQAADSRQAQANQLADENAQLRDENDQYRDELSDTRSNLDNGYPLGSLGYGYAGYGYGGGWDGRPGRPHGGDHDGSHGGVHDGDHGHGGSHHGNDHDGSGNGNGGPPNPGKSTGYDGSKYGGYDGSKYGGYNGTRLRPPPASVKPPSQPVPAKPESR